MNKDSIFILAVRDMSVNKEAKIKNWKKYKDGFVSSASRKTFQKGFSSVAIKKLTKEVGFNVLDYNSSSGGIFLVLSL